MLKISGMATSSKELNNDYNPILDNIDFQINGDSSFHGIGRQKSHSSNIVFFNVRNDHFYFDYKKQPFVLTVTDEKTGKDYNIEIKPEWEKISYGFFDRKSREYQFDLYRFVQKFRSFLQKGDRKNAESLISPVVRDKFPWGNLESNFNDLSYSGFSQYIGDYSGFQHVYTVHLDFGQNVNSKFYDIAEQTYYLVDGKNDWQIIDVAPVHRLTSEETLKRACQDFMRIHQFSPVQILNYGSNLFLLYEGEDQIGYHLFTLNQMEKTKTPGKEIPKSADKKIMLIKDYFPEDSTANQMSFNILGIVITDNSLGKNLGKLHLIIQNDNMGLDISNKFPDFAENAENKGFLIDPEILPKTEINKVEVIGYDRKGKELFREKL